ncbi:MAG TPA: geranylgeranyl reductase family protein [Acidimicrobiia bacterium]|nr:geranylgeranyl reductase family protein [Acidimicrobiia bacterium]
MNDERFDAIIVGAGPAGSVAALVLARGGARVALIDKAAFPRDKACGDLVGPRGVRVLEDLGVAVDGSRVGDMVVVGPTARRVRLPCTPGITYPGYALAIPRARFDATLREAALVAGAVPFTGQAVEPVVGDDGALDGFVLAGVGSVRGDFVIGADGATSRVADAAGLVDASRVLWGFALRSYIAAPVDVPYIVFWEPRRRHPVPGYGWLFPGVDGSANVGLGVGTLADRKPAAQAVRLLPAFLDHLRRLGLLSGAQAGPRLGGWLKMGIVGTRPVAGNVLLVGDAAGLVNPLQGEGIAQAVDSGRAAAEAILHGTDRADTARRYREHVTAAHLPYQRIAAGVQATLLPRPAALATAGRLLTLPGVERTLAEGWGLFWNELVDGAPPGKGRNTALAATKVGALLTSRTAARRWFDRLG